MWFPSGGSSLLYPPLCTCPLLSSMDTPSNIRIHSSSTLSHPNPIATPITVHYLSFFLNTRQHFLVLTWPHKSIAWLTRPVNPRGGLVHTTGAQTPQQHSKPRRSHLAESLWLLWWLLWLRGVCLWLSVNLRAQQTSNDSGNPIVVGCRGGQSKHTRDRTIVKRLCSSI